MKILKTICKAGIIIIVLLAIIFLTLQLAFYLIFVPRYTAIPHADVMDGLASIGIEEDFVYGARGSLFVGRDTYSLLIKANIKPQFNIGTVKMNYTSRYSPSLKPRIVQENHGIYYRVMDEEGKPRWWRPLTLRSPDFLQFQRANWTDATVIISYSDKILYVEFYKQPQTDDIRRRRTKPVPGIPKSVGKGDSESRHSHEGGIPKT